MMNKIKEKKSKKVNVWVLVGVAVLMLVAGFTINEMTNKLFSEHERVEIKKSEVCDGAKLYYEGNGFDIYTYCLDSVKIAGDGDKTELKDLFKTDLTLDNIYETLQKKDVYKDGGSIMFEDAENGIAVLKCNTLEGNEDIYIGAKGMTYEEAFCKNRFEVINENEFEVYFDVLLLTRANDGDIYLTLSVVNVGEVVTVKVKEEDIKTIKKPGDYTFTFETENLPLKYDIKTIFDNAKIVDVRKGN